MCVGFVFYQMRLTNEKYLKNFWHSYNIYTKHFLLLFFAEPRKEKTDVSSGGNGALSPSSEQSCQGSGQPPPGGGNQTPKLERPNSLGQNKISRRIICYHGDHCKCFLWFHFFRISNCNESFLMQTKVLVHREVHLHLIRMGITINYLAIFCCQSCRSHRFQCPRSDRSHRHQCFRRPVPPWWTVDNRLWCSENICNISCNNSSPPVKAQWIRTRIIHTAHSNTNSYNNSCINS